MAISHTETVCIKKLQDIISETSKSFYSYITENIHSQKISKRDISLLLESHFNENDFEKEFENHCRLSALILLLQQTAERRISKSLYPFLHASFENLPENFKDFLKLFSKYPAKKINNNTLNDIEKILEFPSDIIGSVYNKFSYNSYQQSYGQHFTQTAEVDILNAFCIRNKTLSVFDASCGAGVFLIRAFYFFQHFNNKTKSVNNDYNLAGVDISPVATYLSTINFLFRDKNNENNFPKIITENFIKIKAGKNIVNVDFPVDAIVGNPPFIRHEMMKEKREWQRLIKEEHHISHINGQSDLYIYFLIHAASLLKEGGRLGWVISASWLDVQFGSGLQRFLLEHFKIISIIDYQAKRSFDTASVNTVLLVIEKCVEPNRRKNHLVKLVRLYTEYDSIIDKIESEFRISYAIKFAERIENCIVNISEKDIQVEVIAQEQLELNSTIKGKYENGYWGAKYLRSPSIYKKIISRSGKSIFPLSEFVDVKYGIKTGANDFFYLMDETFKINALTDEEYGKIFGKKKKEHLKTWDIYGWYWSSLNGEHFIIEKEFVMPVFKTQKEANKLDVDIHKLKFVVLNCNVPKNLLKEKCKKILAYIEMAENEFSIHKRPSVSGRVLWYDLSSTFVKSDFIFPSKIGEKYRLIDNRKARIVCDKVNYAIIIKKEWKSYADELFLILNSITFRYFIDLFSRQLTGSQTLSDVDVNLLKKTLITHPVDFRNECNDIQGLLESIKSREQFSLSQEILQKDKFEIDLLIGKIIGLKESEVKELYKEAAVYVKNRQLKSDSLKTLQ